jgi:hypothetical protein
LGKYAPECLKGPLWTSPRFRTTTTPLDVIFLEGTPQEQAAHIDYTIRSLTAQAMVQAKRMAGLDSDDDELATRGDEAIKGLLLTIIRAWDLEWDGEQMPVDAASMDRLAFPVRLKILQAVVEDIQNPKSRRSSSGSSPEVNSESAHGGGQFSPAPNGSASLLGIS